MRITHLINQYPKVSHTFIRREIMALERQGFEVQRVALRGWDEKLIDKEDIHEQTLTQYVLKAGLLGLLSAGCSVFLAHPVRFINAAICAIKMGIRADRSVPYHLVYLLEACQTLRFMQAFQSQHIHAHFGTNPSEIAMLVHLLSGIPYSFTVHGPEEFDRPQFLKLKQKIEQAKFVVAISSFGRSQLQRWVDYSHWHKIKVVHCGLEPSFYDVAITDRQYPLKLVCVGRLCEQKGQLLLVEAAKKLADQGIAFELVLAGDGELRQPIEALIQKYQLNTHIKITGWISSDQVRDYLLAARAMVLPSFAEGLPVVIMEAMSLKRPVISTYIAGIPELVEHETMGWLVPAGDVDALTDAMKNALLASEETLFAMGEAAYATVTKRHNIDIEAKKLAVFIQTAQASSQ
ncbi:glycosyltransferase family 4 protein [Methylotenera sp. 1P/1]|uniref:glycosyltransferase family 4 protein n=2 Tax=unclassified Methylotenera TaxID=2643294 RepID=UPI00037F404B|nr:glycosyltransferase family 4 protein [Methylotenera sp. 1P/1]